MPTFHPACRTAISRSPVMRVPVIVRGFTLIEVMIVVAIVAILASVALPAYSDYVRRGSLPEAFTGLSDYRVKMEQYYQDNRNYGAANCADVAGAPSWATFTTTNSTFFTYACALTTVSGILGQGYTITATGRSGTRADGHVYTVDYAGAHATTQFKGASVTAGCWLTKGTSC